MDIQVKGVTIILTEEQLKDIEIQQNELKRKNISIFDRVKTVEDACKEMNIEYNPNASASEKISIVCKALNEGVKIDFKNKLHEKYYPWFIINENNKWSFGVSRCAHVASSGGPGYVVSEEKAIYLGTQFFDLYLEIFNNY